MIRRGQFAGAEEKVKDAATEGSGDPGYVEREIKCVAVFVYLPGEREGSLFVKVFFLPFQKALSLPSPLFLCGSILIDPLVAGSERRKGRSLKNE